jgi:hypothetical protein
MLNLPNLNESNKIVIELIKSNKSFAIGRLGIGEALLFYKLVNSLQVDMLEVKKFKDFGGVYGDCFKEFIEEYFLSMNNMDYHCFWKDITPEFNRQQDDLYTKIGMKDSMLPFEVIEPYYCDVYDDVEEPWSKYLSGKKVLVINPFANSMSLQYKIKDKIWKNPHMLPDFEMIPYVSVQSTCDLNPHSSWVESLSHMKNEISEIDFDIALLGCGCYGLPLCNFIKTELNKSAIYIGGALQILFGIKGSRWDGMSKINQFYNENWIRPSDEERPNKFYTLEGGCYW